MQSWNKAPNVIPDTRVGSNNQYNQKINSQFNQGPNQWRNFSSGQARPSTVVLTEVSKNNKQPKRTNTYADRPLAIEDRKPKPIEDAK